MTTDLQNDVQTDAQTGIHTLDATAPPVTALPVHPRRGGWRAGAASSLVAFAAAQLRAGRSPERDVRAMAQLGGGGPPAGLPAAEELDRRLVAALADLGDDLLLHHARSAAFDGPSPVTSLLGDELADVVVSTLFDTLAPGALVGRPHPGEWVASSVDVVPCAVHGYEDGPVDCLRRSVRAHLSAVVDRAAGVRPADPTAGDLAAQLRALAGSGSASRAERAVADRTVADRALADRTDADRVDGEAALALLWTGVAALAAWQAHVAAR